MKGLAMPAAHRRAAGAASAGRAEVGALAASWSGPVPGEIWGALHRRSAAFKGRFQAPSAGPGIVGSTADRRPGAATPRVVPAESWVVRVGPGAQAAAWARRRGQARWGLPRDHRAPGVRTDAESDGARCRLSSALPRLVAGEVSR